MVAFLPRVSQLLLLVLLAGLPAARGTTETAANSGRPLTPADFDGWRALATPRLSHDGAWLAYAFMPQDGDGDLVLQEIDSGREYRVPVGDLPPPPVRADDENPDEVPPQRNIRIAFTSDQQFAVATTFPPKSALAEARRRKAPPAELPTEGLVVVRLADGAVTRIDGVKSMQVPAKGGAWLAALRLPAPGRAAEPAPDGEPADPEDESAREPSRGSDLILRDLAAGTERVFPHVREYALARDGRTLVFTVAVSGSAENGVFVVTPGEDAAPVPLLAGPGRFVQLAWNRDQTQLAFLANFNADAPRDRAYTLWVWRRGETAARSVVHAGTPGFPADRVLSSRAAPAFTRTGGRLLLAAAPPPAPRAAAPALLPEEKVSADLWHWRDDYVPPMQKVRAPQERNRTFRGIFDPGTNRYTQVATPEFDAVSFTDDGAFAVARDSRAYRRAGDYDGRYHDLHVIDTATGVRRLVLSRVRGQGLTRTAADESRLSPDGRWALVYHEAHWQVVELATGVVRNLTAAAGIRVDNELEDRPEIRPAYGVAGWTRDSGAILLYDRYDVWQVHPDGRPARNLTAGHGRATRTILRVQRIDPRDDEGEEERGLDPAAPLHLRGESEDTRATGFFRADPTAQAAPVRLLWGESNHRYVGRAGGRDRHLVTRSRFDCFPDLHLTDSGLGGLRRLTRAGDQLDGFRWGSAELLDFRTPAGVPLRAALFKPAGFDPGRKYPLIVYLYERLSQTVHDFVPPAPSHRVNPSFYTSNGYLVLMPDVAYTTGHPGRSAADCVLPAIHAAIARGGVDESAIGIQGHSWGGYQAAYLITRTGLFRAAAIGAPVVNMTSAYSGIRWGSGQPRQVQYETGQSRLGRPLHEAPELYLENSPLFRLDAVSTPTLILHNDGDDAVPWYQGIEFFLGLRRLGKPAWLINYNDAPHGLRRRAEQHDYSRRLFQFFEHQLRQAPAPAWLEHGIPYLDRDAEKIRFQTQP